MRGRCRRFRSGNRLVRVQIDRCYLERSQTNLMGNLMASSLVKRSGERIRCAEEARMSFELSGAMAVSTSRR